VSKLQFFTFILTTALLHIHDQLITLLRL